MSTTFSKTNGSIQMVKDFDGILTATFDHEIKSIKGTLQYTGPYLDREMWYAVTSFFRWTYETTKSESQVRLFLNPKTKTWLAWAFPQEARTGMTAKEIENDEFKRQRAALPGAPDLIYLATVHHHCSGSAFQSGTDHANEIGQDGIHITVGSMDKPQHDLHCRLYVSRIEFAPDMSRFWDIGESYRQDLPAKHWDEVARHQMGRKVEVEFPKEWKENLIEIKPPENSVYLGGLGGYGTGGTWSGDWNGDWRTNQEPEFKRIEHAAQDVMGRFITDGKNDERAVFQEVEYLWSDEFVKAICGACQEHKVEFDDVVQEMHQFWENNLAQLREPPKEEKNKKPRKGGFLATHTIKEVPVMWEPKRMVWIRENGWTWNFDARAWIDGQGKPVKEENDTPGSSLPQSISKEDGPYE